MTIDPTNADWQLEVGYAESNLGTLLIDKGQYAEAEQAFRKYLSVDEAALARKPNDPAALIEVGQALSWIGRSLGDQDRNNQAAATFQREISFYRAALARDPGNTIARQATMVAQSSIGWRQLSRGDIPAAHAAFVAASATGTALLTIEPTNNAWRLMWIKAQFGLAETSRFAGNLTAAATAQRLAQEALDRLKASDPKNVDWNISMQARLDHIGAGIAEANGNPGEAYRLAARGIALLAPVAKVSDEDDSYFVAGMLLIAGDAAARLGRPDEAQAAWRRASVFAGGSDSSRSSLKLAARYAADRRLGQTAEAQAIAALLDRRGFRDPLFTRERRR